MNVIIMLLLISLLILVHEIGHYTAAKLFGVRVSKFGFGLPFGPTLFKTKWGETEILIHAFLLGGYVSFPDDEESEKNSLPSDSPELFKNKKPWQKAIIFAAGVFMNVIFAIFLVVVAAAYYQKLPTGNSEVYVKEVVTKDNTSNILNKDIKEGDRILKINGLSVNSSYRFILLVQKSKYYDGYVDSKIVDKKLEDLKKLNPDINPNQTIEKDTVVILPESTPEAMVQMSENQALGLEKYISGEISLTGKEIALRDKIQNQTKYKTDSNITLKELAAAISDTYKPITLTLQRGDKIITLNNIHTGTNGLLGIKLENKEIFTETKTLKDIIVKSAQYTWSGTKMTIIGFKQLITGKIPLSDMHGIVVITKVGSDIIESQGMLNGLLLTAIISINLAIINLLPIPALDGGHLLFLLIEKITGKPLNEKVIERIGGFFFLLLIILMVYVIFNDIVALVTKQF